MGPQTNPRTLRTALDAYHVRFTAQPSERHHTYILEINQRLHLVDVYLPFGYHLHGPQFPGALLALQPNLAECATSKHAFAHPRRADLDRLVSSWVCFERPVCNSAHTGAQFAEFGFDLELIAPR